MSNTEPVELAEEAKKPGVFNILNVLKERGFPTDVVSIIIDDNTAYAAAKVKARIEELMASEVDNINDEVKSLESKLEKLVEKLNSERYEIHITGISEGQREKLVEKALEKFPKEFKEDKNPFSGEVTRTEIESEEREQYFTNLLWLDSIQKIVAPDGSEQDTIDESFIEQFREMISLPSNSSITQAIEKLRIATAMFIISTDEDFLAKP